ncbi:hypothetical protein H0H93_012078, partial [Arthromyces matolae]
WCVALGGTTALDTLGSQAFTGNRPSDLSVHFQRCVILLSLLFIPVGVFWAFIEPILLFLEQPAQLSHDVQSFLRILILGAPGYIGFESLKKYLQPALQTVSRYTEHVILLKYPHLFPGITSPPTIVLVVLSPINVALNLWLIHGTSLGLLGSPIALAITYWLCFALLSLFTFLSPKHTRNSAWGGFQPAAVFDIQNSWNFLRLAIPGVLMVGTEWAAFEIVALAAGRLGELPLAAQSVIMTTDQILNTIPFGIGVAATTRVGNYIGARSTMGAKRSAHASVVLSVVLGAIVMMVLMCIKDVYGRLFSDNDDLVNLVALVIPLVASFQIADGLANSCGGVLRAQGRQQLGAIFNFAAYYVIALPLGRTSGFMD